jgi:FemAB-related protein (PEP-CTERM system-associated)
MSKQPADIQVSKNVVVISQRLDSAVSWDAFVEKHWSGSTFHLSAWQRLIENTFGHEPRHILARDSQNGEVLGVLPMFLVRSRIFGRMLVSTPHAAYGGCLADSLETEWSIVDYARNLAKELQVEFLELRNFRNVLDDSSLSGKDLYVTFRQELKNDPEEDLLSIPRKTRAEIREGIRNGLEFKVDQIGTDEFFQVYSQSVRYLGTPVFPKRLFENGRREFGSDCKIFSVHWNGHLAAAVWTLFYKDEVVPYFGGSVRDYNRLAVNNFMYWMLMKYGAENGYRIFDFGRSKKGSGSFNFKKRWGMEMSQLNYQYALVRMKSLPDTSPLNPKFARAIRLWQRLPLCVTNQLGPIISRHLI